MARSSGSLQQAQVFENLERAEFAGPGDRGTFRIQPDGSGVTYSFADGDVSATRPLDYFIGSGAIGRSYVSAIDGFLFQAPVSYYSRPARWDNSPGFEKAAGPNFLRGVEPGCLRCHSSGVQWIEGTANRYGSPPFLENGVSCERCHGPGEAHVEAMKSGGKSGVIVSPAKLGTARRDSICAQCHLSGVTEISTGKPFRPGQALSDSSLVFVWADKQGPMPVISHFERMNQSKCRQANPDRFWCGTCHDPHAPVAAEKRVAHYRQKCTGCHELTTCTANPKARKQAADDCTACHMPKGEAGSVRHSAFTDHSIPRQPGREAPTGRSQPELVPFGGAAAGLRESALAWADVALRENNRAWGMRAFQLLQKAWAEDAKDLKIASQLAQLYDRMGNETKACELYEQIVAAQPDAIVPAVNLGTCLAKTGRIEESMRLWSEALKRNPALEGARLNLAVAQFRSGDAAAAKATLQEALRLNPASARAREMLKQFEQR